MEFPGGCLTGTYVLNGYEDFAYIVCAVVTPPGPQTDLLKDSNIFRLRNAEKELRSVNFLVAVDLEKLELFMFYRRSDLLRDQKVLIGKIAPVLRSNYLIKSYNSGGKASHLLKPEQSRIYALFTRAILSSTSHFFIDSVDSISLGPRAYLRPESLPSTPFSAEDPTSQRQLWRFCEIDVQILANGAILLTSTAHGTITLSSMTEVMRQNSPSSFANLESTKISLAPNGLIARYNPKQIETSRLVDRSSILDEGGSNATEVNQVTAARRELWRRKLLAWLVDQHAISAFLPDRAWIDIELPTVKGQNVERGSSPVVWTRIEWPAELCFRVGSRWASDFENEKNLSGKPGDPWEFIESWNATARDRADEILRMDRERSREHNSQEQQSDFEFSDDELHFGYTPHFQTHAPQDFLPSQLMYPTPPDGALTQATPGMSSLDGVDMTPAQVTRPSADMRNASMDEEMTGVDAMQGAGVGSGLYDEDLFEDIPGEKFGPAGITDEPNWDFFDQPDFEIADVDASAQSPGDHLMEAAGEEPSQGDGTDLVGSGSDFGISKTDLESPDGVRISTSGDLMVLAMEIPSGAPEGKQIQTIPPSENDQAENFDDVEPQLLDNQGKGSQNAREANSPIETGRRNSSLYEVERSDFRDVLHDSSYVANGKYWFEALDHPDWEFQQSIKTMEQGVYKKSSNSIQEVDSPSHSDTDSMMSEEQNPEPEPSRVYRGWTEYIPVAQEPLLPGTEDLDLISLEQEVTLQVESLRNDGFQLPLSPDTFQEPLDLHHQIDGDDDDLSMIAQIVVDILSQTFFQKLRTDVFSLQTPNLEVADVLTDLQRIDPSWEWAHLEYLSLAGISNESKDTSPRIERLEDHRIRIARADQVLLARPSIKPLWDSLGLQPHSGVKNLRAYCIYPNSRNVADGCGMLLNRMNETYLGCNFGDHITGQIAGITNNGLIAWSSEGDVVPNLTQTCERLGTALARGPATTETAMIYMINPFTSMSSYTDLCRAFYTLLSTYRKSLDKKTKPNEIALQIIPVSFVASPDTIIVPTQAEYLELAIETYNRSPPSNPGDSLAICGSAIVLGEPVQRSIDFDLTEEHISPLWRDGKCLHVAYSYSADDRWITAAWTDEFGYLALTMSYCIRTRGSATSRGLSEIIQEIWEVSQDLMAKHRGKWRLVIGKNGYYQAEEINDWLFHANSNTTTKDKSSTCALVLVSLNLNPALTLSMPTSPQKATMQGPSPSQPTRDYGTPVSTPQAVTTTSPDQMLAATPTPTPGGTQITASSPPKEDQSFDLSTDADISVNDATEESWSVILSHGLGQSRNILIVRPAMVSGYLLKRRGVKDEDGVVSLGVNLIHTSIPPTEQAARDELLKEIIVQYRGLVTLAVSRGCLVDNTRECVPWHVSTAVKGARLLGMVL